MGAKTYSIATKRHGEWFTNWYEYTTLSDIDWEKVKTFCTERGNTGYGYYYGHHSSGMTSARCRTVLWEVQHV